MAIEAQIGGDGTLFVGEDKTFVHEVRDKNGVPVNIAGKNIVLVIAETNKSAPLYTLTGTVTGSYNVDPVLNMQRVSAVITDEQMDSLKGRTYRYSWKVMDFPETITGYGPFVVEKPTAP